MTQHVAHRASDAVANPSRTKLLRITAGLKKSFCVTVTDGKVTQASSLASVWARGLTETEFLKRARLKAWNIEEVPLQGHQEKG